MLFLERLSLNKGTYDTGLVDVLDQLEGGLIGDVGSAPFHPHNLSRYFSLCSTNPSQPSLGSAFA